MDNVVLYAERDGRGINIQDIDEPSPSELQGAVGVCVSSGEDRCLSIPSMYQELFFEGGTVLCLTHEEGNWDRELENHRRLREMCNGRDVSVPRNSFPDFSRSMDAILCEGTEGIGSRRIVIDYTCMPPHLLLSTVYRLSQIPDCEVWFAYDIGSREDRVWTPTHVDDLVMVPGMRGRPDYRGREVYLFSLGYDGPTSAALLEWLQPYLVFSMLADPGCDGQASQISFESNREVIEESAGVFRVPIHSVAHVATAAKEIVGLEHDDRGLVFVPLGPKPHILGLGLLSIADSRVSCLSFLTNSPVRRSVSRGPSRIWTKLSVVTK